MSSLRMCRRSVLTGLAAVPLLGCSPDPSADAPTRGPSIIAHGGGTLDPAYAADIARTVGGKGTPILISPYSWEPVSTGRRDTRTLRNMGFGRVSVLDLSSPAKAIAQIREAGGVWFSGGSQKQQVLALSAVPGVREALHAAYRSNTVMIGSSAGAAVMSRLMISGGTGGAVYTRPGLGFWPDVVLDQHVAQRHREYRLQKVIASNPKLLGIGLDESTWVIFRAGSVLVRGRGAARVVSAAPNGGTEEKRLRSGARFTVGEALVS